MTKPPPWSQEAKRARWEADREEYNRVIAEQTGTTAPKAVGAGWSEGKRKPRRVSRKAGPVTITAPDGSTRVERPLTPEELRKITGERPRKKRRS